MSVSEKINLIDLAFIDRDYYCDLINNIYKNILLDPTYFQVVAFHGEGGIGKTRLVNESKKKMCDTGTILISIKLEITSKDDLLDIFIKFRKALPPKKFYPLFDYAIIILWNSLNVSQLDNEFLSITKKSLFNFLKTVLDAGIGLYSGIPIGSFIDIISSCYDKIKSYYGKYEISRLLDNMTCMETHELIDKLPFLLGNDIHKNFLSTKLIFIIDSFKCYSSHLPDSNSWLTSLIQNIGYGFFIVTSREVIKWPDDMKQAVISKNLDKLPEKEVRKELIQKYKEYPYLVENIITVTECIPIYIDLAVKVINEKDSKLLQKKHFLFQHKEDIIHHFLIHLPKNEREAIIVLAIVQIFDKNIFEHLIKDLHLEIAVYEFGNICNRSLIRNVEYDSYFYKTHDVISENISFIENQYKKERIFESYLTFIHERGCQLYSSIQISMIFKHILLLCIRNNISLSIESTEKILDIFFVIKESLIPFECDEITGFKNCGSLKNIYCLLKALSEERKKSIVRLKWLETIDANSHNFGKHINSFKLMKGYLQALCKSTYYLRETVKSINDTLNISEAQEWYYGQTKIFLGDCCISYGEFKTGIHELKAYAKLLPYLFGKENDLFQVTRHIAHGYRFNMMLEDAEKEYGSIIYGDGIFPTPLQKVYILTNLCETNCYFKAEKVLKIYPEAMALANKFHDLKSKGKICYSLAIVWITKKKYKRARKLIRKSIMFNQYDGYIAGKLYAYMAQAYYEYAITHSILNRTLHIIKSLQKQIQVYGYFSLPISLMLNNYSNLKDIGEKYEWIDYDKTVMQYCLFLQSLLTSP